MLRNYPRRLDLWSVYLDQVRLTGSDIYGSQSQKAYTEGVLRNYPRHLDPVARLQGPGEFSDSVFRLRMQARVDNLFRVRCATTPAAWTSGWSTWTRCVPTLCKSKFQSPGFFWIPQLPAPPGPTVRLPGPGDALGFSNLGFCELGQCSKRVCCTATRVACTCGFVYLDQVSFGHFGLSVGR